MRPLVLLPEILLFVGGLVVLIAGSFLPRRRQWLTRVVAALSLLGCGVAGAIQLAGPHQGAFEGSFAADTATGVARVVAAGAVLLILALAGDEVSGSPRESETYALMLFSTTGALVLAGADDLLVLAVGFLLASIPIYALVGLARSRQGAEAAMKTYLLGALFGIVLLLGVTLLYAVAGGTAYPQLQAGLAAAPHAAVAAGVVAVLAGLIFEAGGVPAHFWVPDAAEASTGVAATFLTTVPKVGALVAAYRLVSVLPDAVAWPLLTAVLAAASMTLGNLAAYWQHDPRRLLGWSTVGQVGFLLVPVAVAGRSPLALPSLLFYLAAYTLTNVAAFAVTTALPRWRDLSDYRGLARSHPWLAVALAVALLGLVGTPPTAVFVGKLTVATAGWAGGFAWLAVLLFLNTLLSLFYYLRWIAPAFGFPRGGDPGAARAEPGGAALPWSSSVAVGAAALSLVIGLSAGLLWRVVDGSLMA